MLQQCWDLGSQIGTIVTTSVGHPTGAKVQIPASQWADGAKHHLPGTMGGCNPRRDSPRFIRLIETGQFDMQSISTATFPLDRVKDCFQAAADRVHDLGFGGVRLTLIRSAFFPKIFGPRRLRLTMPSNIVIGNLANVSFLPPAIPARRA